MSFQIVEVFLLIASFFVLLKLKDKDISLHNVLFSNVLSSLLACLIIYYAEIIAVEILDIALIWAAISFMSTVALLKFHKHIER